MATSQPPLSKTKEELEKDDSVYYAFIGKCSSVYENMITALSTTTLLDEIETAKGTNHVVTQDMSLAAL
eukprot:10003192-Prorocentrum_lima.AAC.1